MTVQITVAAVLATDDPDVGKAGPIGLFLIVSLLIAVFLLGRSMRTHLRRVPLEFPDPNPSVRGRRDPEAADPEVLEGEVLDGPEHSHRSRDSGPELPDASGPDVR